MTFILTIKLKISFQFAIIIVYFYLFLIDLNERLTELIFPLVKLYSDFCFQTEHLFRFDECKKISCWSSKRWTWCFEIVCPVFLSLLKVASPSLEYKLKFVCAEYQKKNIRIFDCVKFTSKLGIIKRFLRLFWNIM